MTADDQDTMERLVRREINEVWNEQNSDAIDEMYTEDVVVHNPSRLDTVRGRKSYQAYVTAFHAVFPDLELTIETVTITPEKAVVRLTGRGTLESEFRDEEPTGEVIDLVGVQVYRVSDDKIAERWGTLLAREVVDAFTTEFAGSILQHGDTGYDDARTVWNGLIDKYPALIARCTGVADVTRAVQFARENDLLVAVRGGGHNVAGTALCDGGLVIDLSEMNGVHVDADTRTVRVQGGATWADVDWETQVFELATPGGVVSDTGVAGLTLGGGLGHLRHKYGLSCDNLVSVEVVTADGEVVTASEEEHEDLFWALRGGGGNFGVTTSFEYQLHPVGPEVMTIFVWHRGGDAAEALQNLREYVTDAPDEASVLAFHATVPELEEFPEERWGESTLVFLGAYAGEHEEGERAFAPLREFGEPIADFSGPMEYTDLQSMLDEDYPEGMNYYWKSLYLYELSEDVIDQLVAAGERAPSPLSTVDVWPLGGAISRVDSDETAFGYRDAPFMLGIEANWEDPDESAENITWARELYQEMQEFSTDGLYVNFPGFGEDPAQAAYGESYDRLITVKTKYDPTNLFRSNQNVVPKQSKTNEE